ncbi:MAG: HEAT repeat domain-containing protein [Phycisphaerae bacterium]|jgi:hypothetical protein
MGLRRRQASARQATSLTLATALVVFAAVAGLSPAAVGDIFHLTSGGRVEGELIEQTVTHYRIRTVLGTVTLTADAVERVEPAPSPFQEYEQRRSQAGDTVAEQTALARWCGEQGLATLERHHWRRVLELDPQNDDARRALGYVRVGQLWIDGRTRVQEAQRPAPETAEATETEEDPEKLAAAIEGNWRRRISAIRSSMLESSLDRQVEKGRAMIAEISDPLAIVPLVEELAGGSVVCRQVLVQALSRFAEDAATVNLVAMALADPDADIRREVISELKRRADSRVTGQFRKALESGDEVLIRRSAEALGDLRAAEAIPELISVLKSRREKIVEVPVRRFFGGLVDPFAPTYMRIGSSRVPVAPVVGISNPASLIDMQRRRMNVTVFRTEVRTALRQITGKDFGFEAEDWARWYQENRS